MTVRAIRAPTGPFDTETVDGLEYISFDGTTWSLVDAEFVDNTEAEGTGGSSIDALSDLPQDGAEDGNGIVWNGTNGEWEAAPIVQFISDLPQDGATTGQVIKWNGSEWAPGDDEEGAAGEGLTNIDAAQLWFLGTRGTAVDVTVGGVDTTSLPFTRIGVTLHFIRGVELNADSSAFQAGRGLWSETSTPLLTNSRNLIG